MNNSQVAARFVQGRPGRNRSMLSEHYTLYSYATPIAFDTPDGIWIIDDRTFSNTTAKQINYTRSETRKAGYVATKEIAMLSWLAKNYGEIVASSGRLGDNDEFRLYKLGAAEIEIPRRLNPAKFGYVLKRGREYVSKNSSRSSVLFTKSPHNVLVLETYDEAIATRQAIPFHGHSLKIEMVQI